MRSFGEFVGHIWRGVKSDPAGQRRVTRHDVHEETRQTPQGSITLKRTVIEEVRVNPPDPAPAPPPRPPPRE